MLLADSEYHLIDRAISHREIKKKKKRKRNNDWNKKKNIYICVYDGTIFKKNPVEMEKFIPQGIRNVRLRIDNGREKENDRSIVWLILFGTLVKKEPRDSEQHNEITERDTYLSIRKLSNIDDHTEAHFCRHL